MTEGSTTDSQLPVVLKGLRQQWPLSSRGTGYMSRFLVVRGAERKHKGLVWTIARKYAHGYRVDVRWLGGHFIVGLEKI